MTRTSRRAMAQLDLFEPPSGPIATAQSPQAAAVSEMVAVAHAAMRKMAAKTGGQTLAKPARRSTRRK